MRGLHHISTVIESSHRVDLRDCYCVKIRGNNLGQSSSKIIKETGTREYNWLKVVWFGRSWFGESSVAKHNFFFYCPFNILLIREVLSPKLWKTARQNSLLLSGNRVLKLHPVNYVSDEQFSCEKPAAQRPPLLITSPVCKKLSANSKVSGTKRLRTFQLKINFKAQVKNLCICTVLSLKQGFSSHTT